MNINTFVNKFKLQPYKFVYEGKDYGFSCSLENAVKKEYDFIFIPLVSSQDFESVLNKVFKNPHCKGVVFNNKLLASDKYKIWLNSFMKIFGTQVEFLAFVPNIYNLALSTILETLMYYNGKIITVVGTEGTSDVVEMLEYALGEKYKISAAKSGWNCWQKLFEPILSAEENTDCIIAEAIPDKLGLVAIAQNFPNNNIIFTKSSIYNMNLYEDLKSLSDELLKSIDNPSFVNSITISEDNSLVLDYLPYYLSDKVHLTSEISKCSECENEEVFDYLVPYKNLVITFLNNQFPNEQFDLEGFMPSTNLFDIYKKNHNDYFVMNSQKVSVNSVLKSLDEFSHMYSDKKKIVIFEYIKSLGEFKESVYEEIFSKLAKINPTEMILVNINNYNHLFRRLNKTTYLLNVKYSVDNPESIDQLEVLLNAIDKETDAAIYFRLNENTLKLLVEEDNEIFS